MLFLPVASVRYFLTLEKNLDLVAQTLLPSWEHIPMEEWRQLILGISFFQLKSLVPEVPLIPLQIGTKLSQTKSENIMKNKDRKGKI